MSTPPSGEAESIEGPLQENRSDLAIFGFILAILVPPAGIIVGFIVLSRRSMSAARRIAIFAIVLGFLVLLAYLSVLLSPALYSVVK